MLCAIACGGGWIFGALLAEENSVIVPIWYGLVDAIFYPIRALKRFLKIGT